MRFEYCQICEQAIEISPDGEAIGTCSVFGCPMDLEHGPDDYQPLDFHDKRVEEMEPDYEDY